MKKILVISDNPFLDLLYVLNSEVYLAAAATLVNTATAAVELLGTEAKKYDLILTLEVVSRENALRVLKKHLKTYSQKIPMIIIGAGKDEVISENIFGVIGKFNIQGILKTSAKILGITAKQMAGLDVGDYYPISITPLLDFTKAPCNIYTQNGSDYKCIVSVNNPIKDLLIDLNGNGAQQVFVNSKDRLVITNEISMTVIDKISAALTDLAIDAPVEDKVKALSDGYEFAAANLFSSEEIKQQMQQIAVASAKVMENVVKEIPTLKSLMAVMLNNKDGFIFTHSMIISYVTNYMIKNTTWGGDGQVEKINFVVFFHDIFLAPIYLKHPELKIESALLENDKLTEEEKETILNHAKLSAELVSTYKHCPMGVDALIAQHHGLKKGRGFTKLYMEDLSPLAKIFLIAEMFVEEFMKSQANDIPFNKMLITLRLNSEFKSPSYTKIIQTLVNVPV